MGAFSHLVQGEVSGECRPVTLEVVQFTGTFKAFASIRAGAIFIGPKPDRTDVFGKPADDCGTSHATTTNRQEAPRGQRFHRRRTFCGWRPDGSTDCQVPLRPARLLCTRSRTGPFIPRCQRFFCSRRAPLTHGIVLSVAVSRRRARASRDITVPIGTSVAWAISR
jgi:hypothetical protein